MRTLSAKVIDPTHLELLEPISTKSGERLEIVIPTMDSGDADWRQAARDRFLASYDDQDAIYDEL